MQHSSIRTFTCAAVTGLLTSVTPLTFAAESSQVAFNNRCRTCHSIKEGDNRLGPSLHNVIGRKAGSLPAFGAYSQAMKSSGIVWSAETLSKFIENPDAVVPGNNMKPYAGVPDEAERGQIVEYLSSLGGKADAKASAN